MVINFRDTLQEQTGPAYPANTTLSPTAEQLYFLDRLNRLSKKSVLLSRYLVPTDRRMRLLNHAILATYEDCRALDVTAEARAIIEEARRATATPGR
ncbi:MAG TPA: hypothetical protein VIL85_26045 [Thermomicrobiales bacterium]|jgi:hypothetical protein